MVKDRVKGTQQIGAFYACILSLKIFHILIKFKLCSKANKTKIYRPASQSDRNENISIETPHSQVKTVNEEK